LIKITSKVIIKILTYNAIDQKMAHKEEKFISERENRTILHMDLDTFFVSVERLLDRALEGKPVIVGGMSDRGVVSACSYEARRYGVHSAMPMKMAKSLCKEAVFIRGDMDTYSRYSRMVSEIIAESAPLFEKASIDEHYLDITGMDRFFGSYSWAHELRRRIIRETGLPISFGLSVNKTVAKIATGEAKPNGEMQVGAPVVRPFMGPLSIRKIPMIGIKTYQSLRAMGVARIATLRDIPPEMMERVLGKNGIALWKKANGIDLTPVIAYAEKKSMSHETTFEQDSIDVQKMKEILMVMTEKLAFQLRKKNKLTGCITVKIRYSDFNTFSHQQKIPYTAFDHVLMEVARKLFDQVYQRRMLIRLIGVKFSDLVGGNTQLTLFGDTPEMASLYQAIDCIRARFGDQAVCRAISLYPGKDAVC